VFHSEGEGVAERLNALFRNKHFNTIEFVLKLFEPYYTTNVGFGVTHRRTFRSSQGTFSTLWL